MATLTRKSPARAHKPFANYSHVVTAQGANKLVFCAGQVAADASGKVLPPDDFEAQTKMVMENLKLALAEGAARADVAGLQDELGRELPEALDAHVAELAEGAGDDLEVDVGLSRPPPALKSSDTWPQREATPEPKAPRRVLQEVLSSIQGACGRPRWRNSRRIVTLCYTKTGSERNSIPSLDARISNSERNSSSLGSSTSIL